MPVYLVLRVQPLEVYEHYVWKGNVIPAAVITRYFMIRAQRILLRILMKTLNFIESTIDQ